MGAVDQGGWMSATYAAMGLWAMGTLCQSAAARQVIDKGGEPETEKLAWFQSLRVGLRRPAW